ncbi:MAG: hypothetical protein ACLGI3_09825, partial [Actinomycetes bacterium]
AEVAAPSGLGLTQTCPSGAVSLFRDVSPAASALTQITISRPAAAQQNDLLLAQVANRDDTYTMTAPAGWTLLRVDTQASSEVTSRLYYKVATSAEPSGYTFNIGQSVQVIGHIVAYSGVSTTTPVDASDWASNYSSTATAPSVTTTRANTRLVHLTAKRQEALAAPGSTTSRWSALSGGSTSSLGVSAGEESFAGPGATVPRSVTSGSNFSSEWVAQTVALRPAPGTPTANATWTASPSTWATGHRLERGVGGTVQATQTVTPISATAATDGPLVNGTTYSYRLWAYSGTWASPAITATFTPSC